jgi:anti-sigma regulatory factor (Ser/Thr protein kinase)/ABC-type transporter Mla MlaB component
MGLIGLKITCFENMQITIKNVNRLDFYQSVLRQEFAVDYRDETLRIDLSEIQFIDPFGFVFLKIYLEELLARQNELEIILNPAIVNYLVRMDFHEYFRDNSNITFIPDILRTSIAVRDRRDRLLELRQFSVKNDDQVERVVEDLVEIISTRIDYYHKIKEGLWISLSETISNVQLHSQVGIALVAVQTYQTDRGESVLIAVGDQGVGIQRGLKSHGAGLKDEDAIESALEPLITGRDDRGGTGLTDLRDYILENNDALGIRTCNGYLYIKNGNVRKGDCSFLPGTQLSIRLNNY